jgi:uncharacterized repeat protein (TIGR01451 family)
MIEYRGNSKVSRTIAIASVVVLAAVMMVSAGSFLSIGKAAPSILQSAEAQLPPQHGLGALKVCQKVNVGDPDDCFFSANNLDQFDDTIQINDACDTMSAVQHCLSTNSNIEIVEITDNGDAGDTTCVVSGSVPCEIGHDDVVVFHDASFIMNTTTSDQAAIIWVDLCDSPTTTACDSVTPQSAQAGSVQVVINASIDVVKSLNTTKVLAGQPIEVTANVTNTGSVTLDNVNATDSEAGNLVCGDTTLSAGESTLCTGTFNPTDSGSNTVTVEGAYQIGSVSDTDSEDFTVINPSIDVEKTCSPEDQTAPGTITWTITTTNTGDVSLDATVTDTRHGSIFSGSLAPSESNVTTIIESGLGAGSYTDNATASGEHQLGSVEDTDSATCTVESIPLIGYTVGGGRVNAPSSALPPDGNNGRSFIVTHGFELHCNRTFSPNMLEVNWLGNQFHLERVDNVLCQDNYGPTKAPPEPPGPSTDTYIAQGTGRYNGECGATVDFILTDQGEPGTKDQIVLMRIWDKNGTPVLDIESPLNLKIGNHQWTPHPSGPHHVLKTNYGPCTGEI